MWEKIETKEMIADLTIGKILRKNPNGSGKVYEIRSIGEATIKAINKDGVIALKIFTEKELLSCNWFVKKL
jgi:hypothetical protein